MESLSKESQPKNPEFRNNPKNFNPCWVHEILVLTTMQLAG